MNRPLQTAFTLSGDGQSTPPLADVPIMPISAALPVTPPSKSGARPLPDMPYGTALCYCTVCGEYFRSEAPFTMHRPGDYEQNKPRPRCLTPDEMRARGMAQNRKGQWVTELYDGPPRRSTQGGDTDE